MNTGKIRPPVMKYGHQRQLAVMCLLERQFPKFAMRYGHNHIWFEVLADAGQTLRVSWFTEKLAIPSPTMKASSCQAYTHPGRKPMLDHPMRKTGNGTITHHQKFNIL